MKKCDSCGHLCSNEDKYCPACSKPFELQKVEPVSVHTKDEENQVEEVQKPKFSKATTIILTCIGVILFVAICFGINRQVEYTKNKKSTSSTTNVSSNIIFDDNTQRLSNETGISEKTAKKILDEVAYNEEIRDISIYKKVNDINVYEIKFVSYVPFLYLATKDNIVSYSYKFEDIKNELLKNESQTQSKNEEQQIDWKNDGQYKVGTDLKAGEYVLIATSDTAYLSVAKDSTNTLDSIIFNENFSNNIYITVKDGQYLTVSRAKFIEVKQAPNFTDTQSGGMFKVGRDIKAGEYKIVSNANSDGYVAVYKNSILTLDNMISNDNFSGEKYITVKNGQYLNLERCKIKK